MLCERRKYWTALLHANQLRFRGDRFFPFFSSVTIFIFTTFVSFTSFFTDKIYTTQKRVKKKKKQGLWNKYEKSGEGKSTNEPEKINYLQDTRRATSVWQHFPTLVTFSWCDPKKTPPFKTFYSIPLIKIQILYMNVKILISFLPKSIGGK